MTDPELTVTFSYDQALVLSDWLDRSIGTARFDALVDEEPALWSPVYRLAGALETTLPHIFAPDYTERIEHARRRLLLSLGRSRPARPSRQNDTASQPESPREVGGWVHEDNVLVALQYLSHFVGYGFDELDEAAFIGALEQTDDQNDDETDDKWFQYPLEGSPKLSVRMARAVGASAVMVSVSGRIGDVLAARIETLLMMLDAPSGPGAS